MNKDDKQLEIPKWLLKVQAERELQKRIEREQQKTQNKIEREQQEKRIKNRELKEELEKRRSLAYMNSTKKTDKYGRKIINIEINFSPKRVAIALAILIGIAGGVATLESNTHIFEKGYRYTLGDPTWPLYDEEAIQLRSEYNEILEDYFKGERPLTDVHDKVDSINNIAIERSERSKSK